MFKKAMIVLAASLFAVLLVMPARANAQVAIGVGIGPDRTPSVWLCGGCAGPVRCGSGSLRGGGAEVRVSALRLSLAANGCGRRAVVARTLRIPALCVPWRILWPPSLPVLAPIIITATSSAGASAGPRDRRRERQRCEKIFR